MLPLLSSFSNSKVGEHFRGLCNFSTSYNDPCETLLKAIEFHNSRTLRSCIAKRWAVREYFKGLADWPRESKFKCSYDKQYKTQYKKRINAAISILPEDSFGCWFVKTCLLQGVDMKCFSLFIENTDFIEWLDTNGEDDLNCLIRKFRIMKIFVSNLQLQDLKIHIPIFMN